MDAENRKGLLTLLEKIPHGVPDGWKREIFAVGGLMYLGFSNVQTEKLVVVSSQKQSVIDCKTGERVFCDGNCDEQDLIACAEPLGDELVPVVGLEGGGLRRSTPTGDGLDLAAPFWPREQIIFMPRYTSWYQHPERCTVIFDDYGVLAYGFSRCGNYLALGTSGDLTIFKRTGV